MNVNINHQIKIDIPYNTEFQDKIKYNIIRMVNRLPYIFDQEFVCEELEIKYLNHMEFRVVFYHIPVIHISVQLIPTTGEPTSFCYKVRQDDDKVTDANIIDLSEKIDDLLKNEKKNIKSWFEEFQKSKLFIDELKKLDFNDFVHSSINNPYNPKTTEELK